MATIKQYMKSMWTNQKIIAQKLGLDLRWSDQQTRVMALSTDACIAVLVKTLTDKGVITDQELQAAAALLQNADFPQLPSHVSAPGDDGVVPDPDLGV